MFRPVIAVAAFDRISPFHLSVPCVVFGDAHPGLPAFDFRVCAAEPGRLTTTAGFDLLTRHGLEALDDATTIIVPSWRDAAERPPQALLDALIRAHGRGAQLVGLCLGAYVLAETGLLDGRNATTHWAYADDFAQRYPRVRLDADILYVEDGNLITSAGTAAGIDCCLHMIRRGHGARLANSIARRLVIAPHRQGGQAQFIEQTIPLSTTGTRLAATIDWLRAHLDQPHDIEALAARAGMSRRSFTRHFRHIAGTTLGQWLQNQRLNRSQQLLETTDLAIEEVATAAGFGSAESLRLYFRKAFGVAPSAWRASFRA